MYIDEQLKVIEKDRDQAKQLNVYLLAGLLEILQSTTLTDAKFIVTNTIEKGKTVYSEAFPNDIDEQFNN